MYYISILSLLGYMQVIRMIIGSQAVFLYYGEILLLYFLESVSENLFFSRVKVCNVTLL
jgi:hypothetical protein